MRIAIATLVGSLVFFIVVNGAGQTGNDLFQQALVRQTANSDVPGAIQILERIVLEFRSDRPLVARALVQLGKCYESLNRPGARDFYEQVVRDYPEQTDTVVEARNRMSPNPTPPFQITTPTSDPFAFAVSPDGKSVVYAISEGIRGRLWLHDVATNKAAPIRGGELNRRLTVYGFPTGGPFWSPDSKTIGYFSEGKLLRIAATGGNPRVLAQVPDPSGGAWNQGGVIIFGTTSQLFRVPADGSTAAVPLGINGTCPEFFPNGRDFLYFQHTDAVSRGQAAQVLAIGSIRSKESRLLPLQAFAGKFVLPDQLLFATGQGLFAQRVNLETLELMGSPSRIAESVAIRTAWCEMAVSAVSSVLAYRTSFSVSERQLVWLNRLGQNVGAFTPDPSAPCCARISPDGRSVIFGRDGGGAPAGSLWLIGDVPDAEARRLVAGAREGVWSPEGDAVMIALFRPRPPGGPRIAYFPLTASSGNPPLREEPLEWPVDWSRDGKYLLYETTADLMALPILDTPRNVGEPIPVVQTKAIETGGRFSPNGKWIAYQSSIGPGQSEIFVQPFTPDSNSSARRLALGSGSAPRWRGDNGQELYFISPDLNLMSVTVNYVGEKLELGTPTLLFPLPVDSDYDVSPDGQRFLINRTTRPAVAGPLTVRSDWTRAN